MKKNRRRPGIAVLGLLVLAIVTVGCADDTVVFEENVEIPNARWASSEKAILTTHISDTISQNNFLINVRNTDAYPYRNLYLFVKTIFPNGKSSNDTVGLILADKTGRWIGQGSGYLSSGSYTTNSVMYQYNRRFPLKGEYVFEIEQAMRVDTLVGIQNIGLRIENNIGRGSR